MIWCCDSSNFFRLLSSSWFIIYKSKVFRKVFCSHLHMKKYEKVLVDLIAVLAWKWILLENSLDYPVNVFLCAYRHGTSIVIYALEWSQAVLAAPRWEIVEWVFYHWPNTIAFRKLRLSGCSKSGAFWVLMMGEKILHFMLCFNIFSTECSSGFSVHYNSYVLAPFIASDGPEIRLNQLNT
jgi:hypothetical protein